jgi:hypothetical protein
MAEILVRNLDPEVVNELKQRARGQGRSLQTEVKEILVRAAKEPELDAESARRLCLELRRKLKGRRFPDPVELIRSGRERR